MGIVLIIIFAFYNGPGTLYGSSAGIGLIAGSLFTFGIYFFEKQRQYLTIKNGMLIRSGLFPKKIKLDRVVQIKKFAGDYILLTDKEKFTIDTQILEWEDLVVLERELNL